jgi:hypothetical protein
LRKKTNVATTMPAPGASNTSMTPKAPSLNKGPTPHKCRLMIKRDSSALTTIVINIRDSVNSVLKAILIQHGECNLFKDLIFTSMAKVQATLLHSKISQFLQIVPDIISIYWDFPST